MPRALHFESLADEPEGAVAFYEQAFGRRSTNRKGRWNTG